MADRIRVLVADDEALVRGGLVMILNSEPGIEVVGEAADGAQAVSLARSLHPDVVCMDVRMPGVDGIRATELILAMPSPPRVLVITTFSADDYVLDALRVGAAGFVLKRVGAAELLRTVRTVASGDQLLFPAELRRLVAGGRADRYRGEPLTDREREVLALVAEGLTNAEIAARLVVGTETIKSHVAALLRKLPARDRTHAVVIAYTQGLVAI